MRHLPFAFVLLVAGCGGDGVMTNGNGATGDPCASNSDCTSSFCLPDPFPGGYCSSDCSTMACNPNDVCKSTGGSTACLKTCKAPTDCRSGYVCFQGVCQLPCTSDPQCGKGFGCTNGSCTPLPGKAIGSACAADSECSSRLCDPNTHTCQLSCVSDASCSGGTCWVNPIDANGDNSTDGILPICIKRRGGGAQGSECKNDAACDSGQCELGVCVSLCESAGNCAAMPPMSCVGMFAQVDIGAPQIKGCILKNGTITYNLGASGTGPVGMPSTTLSFNIFVEAKADNVNFFAGLTDLEDPTNRSLYTSPMTAADYLSLPIRYQPTEASTMMLVSNAPNRVTVGGGVYQFGTFAESGTGQMIEYNTKVRIKVGDAYPTAGSIPLHVFVTDLSGGCTTFTANTAHNRLAQAETRLVALFAQAGLTVGPIVYLDSTAPSSITVPDKQPYPELDDLLKSATLNDQADVLELTIIKKITSQGNANFEILGISGGIPASTGISGTAHSGATVSLSPLCEPQVGNADNFALTAAHELSHSLGLYHSLEQDNTTTDPLTDTKANPMGNLMYWEEGTGVNLTPQQSRVMLGNPAVH